MKFLQNTTIKNIFSFYYSGQEVNTPNKKKPPLPERV